MKRKEIYNFLDCEDLSFFTEHTNDIPRRANELLVSDAENAYDGEFQWCNETILNKKDYEYFQTYLIEFWHYEQLILWAVENPDNVSL